MKGISLYQPWASLMAAGVKTVETRSWETKHRGKLVICATKATPSHVRDHLLYSDDPDWDEIRKAMLAFPRQSDVRDALSRLPCGVALCVVDLHGCEPTHLAKMRESVQEELAFGNYSKGRYAWLTSNLRPFSTPFPVKGKQCLFDVPDEQVRLALSRSLMPQLSNQ